MQSMQLHIGRIRALSAAVLALVVMSGAGVAEAQMEILVYGPGGTGSVSAFTGGPSVTVANAATWNSMTTAQFAAYDLIWVDANDCASSPAALVTLYNTQNVWGPAVTGRVAIAFTDPDWHNVRGSAAARTYISNHQNWLGSSPGGATGMMLATGCAYFRDNGAPYISSLEPTFGAPLTTVFINNEPTGFAEPGHPLLAGLSTGSLSWGTFGHGGLGTTIPSGWNPLINCSGPRLCEIYRQGGTVCTGCMIGGICRADGSVNPANQCQICDVATTDTGWTNRPDGFACDDGLFCSVSDQCTAGTCGGSARDCADTLDCTDDACDDTIDACTHPIAAGCVIAGACIADGAIDPGNQCRACRPATSTTGWSPLPAGTGCDDSLFCTLMDECDGAGACAGLERSCVDGLDCTRDSCDEVADECVNDIFFGCAIDGACYMAGTVNPENPCEACSPLRSETEWSPVTVGSPCDDGLFCTVDTTCSADGSCSGSPRDCSDGLTCTLDSCDEDLDECVNDLTATSCTIDGMCVADGARNPDNSCEECNAALSRDDWSLVPAGEVCDDGEFCSAPDTCDGAGVCVAGPPRSCDDELACTTDTCDDTTSACVNTITDGCVIDGTCVATGMRNPSNDCESCDPTRSRTAWSPRAVGESCDDGLFCTEDETCDAAAVCVGVPKTDCDDDLDCTFDRCDPTLDACVFVVTLGCLVDGECIDEGDVDPDDPCRACAPDDATDDYSVRPEGSFCGEPMCMDGVITPAPTCTLDGTCIDGIPVPCPEDGFCLDESLCGTGCLDDTMCLESMHCMDGECVDDFTDGTPCGRDAECDFGVCIDGVCCDRPCDGTCESCAIEGSVGTCTPYEAGTDPEDECPDGSCDGAGMCVDDDPGVDAGPGETDAGPAGVDAGPAEVDAGPGGIDAGPVTTTGGPSGGSCGSSVAGDSHPAGWILLALALVLVRRRRR